MVDFAYDLNIDRQSILINSIFVHWQRQCMQFESIRYDQCSNNMWRSSMREKIINLIIELV